jgi:hypothetical protein
MAFTIVGQVRDDIPLAIGLEFGLVDLESSRLL